MRPVDVAKVCDVCVTSVSMPDLVSCITLAICVDCNSRMPSSILSIVAPSLPQYPGLESKFIKPFNYLFRSLNGPDRIDASKVSISTCFRSTNVCRFKFNSSASTAGSNDHVGTFGVD